MTEHEILEKLNLKDTRHLPVDSGRLAILLNFVANNIAKIKGGEEGEYGGTNKKLANDYKGEFLTVLENYYRFSNGGIPRIDFITETELGIIFIGGEFTCMVVLRSGGHTTGHS